MASNETPTTDYAKGATVYVNADGATGTVARVLCHPHADGPGRYRVHVGPDTLATFTSDELDATAILVDALGNQRPPTPTDQADTVAQADADAPIALVDQVAADQAPTGAGERLTDTGAQAIGTVYARQADGSTLATAPNGRTWIIPAMGTPTATNGLPVELSRGTRGVQATGRIQRYGIDGRPYVHGGSVPEDTDRNATCAVCSQTTSVRKFPTISASAYRLNVHRTCNADRLVAANVGAALNGQAVQAHRMDRAQLPN